MYRKTARGGRVSVEQSDLIGNFAGKPDLYLETVLVFTAARFKRITRTFKMACATFGRTKHNIIIYITYKPQNITPTNIMSIIRHSIITIIIPKGRGR